jgi:hypothetical protein
MAYAAERREGGLWGAIKFSPEWGTIVPMFIQKRDVSGRGVAAACAETIRERDLLEP